MKATGNHEFNRTTEYDEDIFDAMSDALNNCDGRVSAKYLRHALREKGLCIAVDIPVGWKTTNPENGKFCLWQSQTAAANVSNEFGHMMDPVYAEIK